MDKRVISFLEEMIDTLTFRRVALLCLLATIVITMLSIFENRSALFSMMYRSAETEYTLKWDVGNESKSELNALMSAPLVGGIVVTEVNLKQNRRIIKYFTIRDQELLKIVKPTAVSIIPQALFDYDAKNTQQMVAMLNNEFLCSPTKDTIFMRFFPEFQLKLPYMCRLAVPPFFGEFAGYITAALTRQPTPAEFDALKIEINRIAVEMYLRDIAKKPGSAELVSK